MSRYANAFTRAMEITGISNARVIEEVGGTITPANVSHWRHGRRPIPPEYAPALGRLLKVEPELISEAYARLLQAQTDAGQARPSTPSHVTLDRLDGFGPIGGGPQHVVIPEFLIQTRVGRANLSDVRWTFQPSTAMAPAIERDAFVLLDASITSLDRIVDRGVYAYVLWGRPDIRRVLIRREGLALACFSRDADHTFVPKEDITSLELLGEVVDWINTSASTGFA